MLCLYVCILMLLWWWWEQQIQLSPSSMRYIIISVFIQNAFNLNLNIWISHGKRKQCPIRNVVIKNTTFQFKSIHIFHGKSKAIKCPYRNGIASVRIYVSWFTLMYSWVTTKHWKTPRDSNLTNWKSEIVFFMHLHFCLRIISNGRDFNMFFSFYYLQSQIHNRPDIIVFASNWISFIYLFIISIVFFSFCFVYLLRFVLNNLFWAEIIYTETIYPKWINKDFQY